MRRPSGLGASDLLHGRLAPVLAMFSVAAVGTGCMSPCENDLVSSELSPDRTLQAVTFVQGCGTTVRVKTGVSVLLAGARVPKSGEPNALAVADDPAHPIERSGEAIEVRLRWISSRRLAVSYPRAALVGKRAARANGVAIEYTTF